MIRQSPAQSRSSRESSRATRPGRIHGAHWAGNAVALLQTSRAESRERKLKFARFARKSILILLSLLNSLLAVDTRGYSELTLGVQKVSQTVRVSDRLSPHQHHLILDSVAFRIFA